jgi:hypothetical protein
MYCDSAAVLPSLLLSETLREREATPSAWQLLETLRVACFFENPIPINCS